MYEYYIFPNHEKYIKTHFSFEWSILTADLIYEFNTFLYTNCKYLLIYHDKHFLEYLPIIIINKENDEIKSIFEFLYNPQTNIGEIYNVCVKISSRRNGYAKKLNTVFKILQDILKCDLWIAVSFNNPMYTFVLEMYKKMGFMDDIKSNTYTPSKIYYPTGFTELWKKYIKVEST